MPACIALLEERKCTTSQYLERIEEEYPSIHETILSWGDEQFFYTHQQPHFRQDTNNPCESLNGRMRLPMDMMVMMKPVRNSNCCNILCLVLNTKRLECLALRPDPNLARSG